MVDKCELCEFAAEKWRAIWTARESGVGFDEGGSEQGGGAGAGEGREGCRARRPWSASLNAMLSLVARHCRRRGRGQRDARGIGGKHADTVPDGVYEGLPLSEAVSEPASTSDGDVTEHRCGLQTKSAILYSLTLASSVALVRPRPSNNLKKLFMFTSSAAKCCSEGVRVRSEHVSGCL